MSDSEPVNPSGWPAVRVDRFVRVLATVWAALLGVPASAGHVDAGAYPYTAEVTIALTAQEKFYLVDPADANLFRESSTTRLAAYRVWGTGLLSTQNDPDDGDPHGPLKDMGFLVHEMGHNRGGESTLAVRLDGTSAAVHLRQVTELLARDGRRIPDVDIDLTFEALAGSELGGARTTLRPTPAGRRAFRAALGQMVRDMTERRRAEIGAQLADNGLRLIPGTEQVEVRFPGDRELRVLLDTRIGAARVKLPDITVFMSARIEQTYALSEDERDAK